MVTLADAAVGQETTLGKLVEPKAGFAIPRSRLTPTGVPHLRPNNITARGELQLRDAYYIDPSTKPKIEDFHLKRDDILYNNTNSLELVGKSALVPDRLEAAFSNHVTRLRVIRPDLVDARWLSLWLRSRWLDGHFRANAHRWIGQAAFNVTQLMALRVELPDRELQERIADHAAAMLAEAHAVRDLVDGITRDSALMIDAVAREAHASLSGHPSITLGELQAAERLAVRGGKTPSKKEQRFWDGDVAWFAPRDLKTWGVTHSISTVTDEAVDELSMRMLAPGAVLVVVRGMILARSWPIAVTRVPATINQDLKALVATDERLLPEFLAYMLLAQKDRVVRTIEMSAHGTRRLTTDKLLDLTIPEIGLADQRQIVERLDRIREEVAAVSANQSVTAETIDQLERAITARAARGELA